MKVLFQSRRNVFTRPGGDSVQLLKTKEWLKKLGIHVEVSVDSQATLDGYDIIHVFNITGQCQTTLLQILNAKKQKKPVVLSSIYWDGSELQSVGNRIVACAFIKEGDFLNFFKYLTTSVLSGSNRQRVLDSITFLKDKLMEKADEDFKTRIALGYRTIQQMCLHLADIILPNSTSEADLLIRNFGIPREKIIVVPNAVGDCFFKPDPNLFVDTYGFEEFVLSVANLGARKNTLALIKALLMEKIPLVLIGASNPKDAYCRLCEKAARRGHTMILGQIPHESPLLASAYGAAKVHALVSWYETPGLSSLEAAVAGCNVVTTDRGSMREYFKHYAWYCDPTDLASIRNAVLEAYYSPRRNNLKLHILNNYTWDKVAKKTLEAYHRVMDSRRS